MLHEMFKNHFDLLLMFWRDKAFRAPMLVIWVASFGGALHAPVTTYFYLEVGATATDIGWMGFTATLGGLVHAPFYGWLLDTKSAYTAMMLSN